MHSILTAEVFGLVGIAGLSLIVSAWYHRKDPSISPILVGANVAKASPSSKIVQWLIITGIGLLQVIIVTLVWAFFASIIA